jgi:hypothetical protein
MTTTWLKTLPLRDRVMLITGAGSGMAVYQMLCNFAGTLHATSLRNRNYTEPAIQPG